MNRTYQQFADFFDKQKWEYHQFGERPVIHLYLSGDNARWLGVAVAREEEDTVAFLSIFPSKAPPNRRAACAELITRLNYGLKYGSFQMDFEDGEIRFFSSLFAPADETTPEQIEKLVFFNLFSMDHSYDAIMKVIHGGMSPKRVLTEKPKKAKAPSIKARFRLN